MIDAKLSTLAIDVTTLSAAMRALVRVQASRSRTHQIAVLEQLSVEIDQLRLVGSTAEETAAADLLETWSLDVQRLKLAA